MARLGLDAPVISWTSARDRFAEFVLWLALVTATLDKIGHEVYNLQRSEIGELAEPATAGDVGSITMPQKRNPERSEHLGTLARLVRRDADLMLESMVGDHERDGRSWKTEWAAIPEACVAAGAALRIARELVGGLGCVRTPCAEPRSVARNGGRDGDARAGGDGQQTAREQSTPPGPSEDGGRRCRRAARPDRRPPAGQRHQRLAAHRQGLPKTRRRVLGS
jgi:hypothetical protein